MFLVKIRLEGVNYNIYFRGRGGGTQGEWIVMFTMQKGLFFRVNLFFALLRIFRASSAIFVLGFPMYC